MVRFLTTITLSLIVISHLKISNPTKNILSYFFFMEQASVAPTTKLNSFIVRANSSTPMSATVILPMSSFRKFHKAPFGLFPTASPSFRKLCLPLLLSLVGNSKPSRLWSILSRNSLMSTQNVSTSWASLWAQWQPTNSVGAILTFLLQLFLFVAVPTSIAWPMPLASLGAYITAMPTRLCQ